MEAVAAMFGLAVGSFLNVLIARLPAGERITGRSRCPRCRAEIRWYDNVPLLSYLLLRGRCRQCGQPIAWHYPVVELATAVLFVLIAWQHLGPAGLGNDASAIIRQALFVIRNTVAVAALLVVFFIDLKHYVILDVVTLPAAAVVGLLNVALGVPFGSLALGGILGAGFFALQYVMSRGRWIGDGDIRLGLLLGVLLGWQQLLVSLALAYGSGAVAALGLVALGRKRWGSQIPFGTFLAVGGVVALLWGGPIVQWYRGLLGG